MTVELVKSPFDICLNLLIMCKESYCVRLGQEGVVSKSRARELPEAGSKGGCFKKGAGTPLQITNINQPGISVKGCVCHVFASLF